MIGEERLGILRHRHSDGYGCVFCVGLIIELSILTSRDWIGLRKTHNQPSQASSILTTMA